MNIHSVKFFVLISFITSIVGMVLDLFGARMMFGVLFGGDFLWLLEGGFSIVLMVLIGICTMDSFTFQFLAWLRFREISIEQDATLKSEFLGLFNLSSWRKKS